VSEPTIDERLDFLRDIERGNLEAIRAFVERVEKRLVTMPSYAEFEDAMQEELAAMEKEASE